MISKKNIFLAESMLVIVAIVWGGGFIATEYALQAEMAKSLVMSIRFSVAALVMLGFCIKDFSKLDKKHLLHGCVAGTLLFLGFYIQIIGQDLTTVSNASFLTSTNVVMVPFIVWIISKHKPKTKTFILATTTLVGIGVLTLQPGQSFSFNIGDIWVLVCAVLFALHISYLGIFSVGLNAKLLTFLQLATAGIISTVVFFIVDFQSTTLISVQAGIVPVLYLALFSTCFCYFFQTTAQQIVPPGKVGIILCTEGLFGSLFSIILGLEPIKTSIVVGGLIIISSVMLTEVDISFKRKKH